MIGGPGQPSQRKGRMVDHSDVKKGCDVANT